MPDLAAYVVMVTGSIKLDGVPAGRRDDIVITGENAVNLTAVEDSELVLVDVPLDGRGAL